MQMWFNGGGVFMAAVALLAVAQPRLVDDVDDDNGTDEAYACYARYLSVPQEHGVLLAHQDQPDIARYVAAVRSPLTIVNARLGNLGKLVHPFGLLVLLLATTKETKGRSYNDIFASLPQHRRSTRLLVVVAAFGVDLSRVFATANEYCMRNVAVLRVAGNDTRVYTHHPFGGGACGQRRTPEVLGQCQRLRHLDQLYPDKEPRHFDGCKVRLSAAAPPPAVIDAASMSEQPLVAGFQVALANIVTRRLNLSATKLTYWGGCKLPYSYYTDPVRWYVPVAGPRAQWKGPVLLFSAPLWLAVLAFFVFNALVWWVAGVGGFAHCVLGSLVTLLNGAESLPQRTHRRFLIVAWTLCSLVLVAAYQSQLLSTLLTPVPEPQSITNEQELLASDVPIVYDRKVLRWDHPNKKVLQAHRYKYYRSNKPPARFLHDLTAKYLARDYVDARGRPTQVAFAEVSLYKPLCLQFDYRVSTLHYVQRVVRRLVEAGLLAKFMRDVDFSGYWLPSEPEDEPLSLGHLGFAFVALLLGSALAVVVFVVEVVWWRLQHGWWRALCTGVKWCATRVQGCWRTGVRLRWRRGSRRCRDTFRRRVLAQLDDHHQ